MKDTGEITGIHETLEEHEQLEDIDDNDLSEFLEHKSASKQEESSESLNTSGWSLSSLLPEGWQYQKQVDQVMFLSEEGTFLTQADVASMYKFVGFKKKNPRVKTMVNEWKSNEYLPDGWLCKDRSTGILMKSDDGVILKTYTKAAAFMKANTKYNQSDIRQLFRYPSGTPFKGATRKVDVGDWKTNAYLPEGWLCEDKKKGVTGIFLCTPDGTKLRSYTAAKAYMEENINFKADDIARLLLYPDGKHHIGIKVEDWKTSEYLPKGWICKDKKEGATNISVRTDEGTLLDSYTAAARYMEAKDEFTQENIDRLHLYPDGKHHKFVVRENVKNKKLSWKSNEYLPDGWMFKEKGGSSCDTFKTSDGTRLKSYMAAASYMEQSCKYSQEEITRFYLCPDGKSHKNTKKCK